LETETKKLPGRNDPCHCGSGKKYKNCHLDQDEAAARAARAKAAEEAAAEAPAAPAEAGPPVPGSLPRRAPARGATAQPWKRGAANVPLFQRKSTPRKVGSS
jgi:hypothetical protein